jgi:hypothetical protein
MPQENNPTPIPKEQNQKVVEKYYIEVNPSGFRKFLHGLLGGLGWGVGITLGTSLLLLVIGYIVSRIDFVPILGQFLSDVVKSATTDLK